MGKNQRKKTRHSGGLLLSALAVMLLATATVPTGTAARMVQGIPCAVSAPAASLRKAGRPPAVVLETPEPPAVTAAPEAPAEEDQTKSPPAASEAETETASPEEDSSDGPEPDAPPPTEETDAPTQEEAPEESEGVSSSTVVSTDPAPLPEPDASPEEAQGTEEPSSSGAAMVGDDYFDDTVFLGDSRTEGFRLYSGLKTGQYLCSVGATVSSVFTKATEETDAGKVPILDALDGMEFSKVYVMLGVNELGWPHTTQFHDQFCKIVDRIWESHPGATVVLQSILPVSSHQDAKGNYVNNGRIAEYNAVIAQVAQEKGCTYLDVGAGLAGSDGCLPSKDNFDGVHLNVSGCKKWLQFLKEHPV